MANFYRDLKPLDGSEGRSRAGDTVALKGEPVAVDDNWKKANADAITSVSSSVVSSTATGHPDVAKAGAQVVGLAQTWPALRFLAITRSSSARPQPWKSARSNGIFAPEGNLARSDCAGPPFSKRR